MDQTKTWPITKFIFNLLFVWGLGDRKDLIVLHVYLVKRMKKWRDANLFYLNEEKNEMV